MENLYFALNSFLLRLSFIFSPLTTSKISATEKEEKHISAPLPTVLSSSQLPFHFLKHTHTHTHRLIASKPSLDVFSFALWLILIVKRRRVKLIWLPFIFLGDTVMLDYVMFFRCVLWNRSVGRPSPAMVVYVPQRRTRALLSGEKLSILVLIWLCVWRFSRTLENCSRLVGVLLLVTGPWMFLMVSKCEQQT